MEDAPQFIQEPETRGYLGEQQSAQRALTALTGNYLFIIYSISSFFTPSPPFYQFSQLQPHFFSPLTVDLVQGEIPNPSHEQQEQQDLCLRSMMQTNTSLGIADSCPCSLQRKSSTVPTALLNLLFNLCTRSLRIRLY